MISTYKYYSACNISTSTHRFPVLWTADPAHTARLAPVSIAAALATRAGNRYKIGLNPEYVMSGAANKFNGFSALIQFYFETMESQSLRSVSKFS